eukprot:scaffold1793_cov245-Pinguiococcus_pyrenoidosus.AAC.5
MEASTVRAVPLFFLWKDGPALFLLWGGGENSVKTMYEGPELTKRAIHSLGLAMIHRSGRRRAGSQAATAGDDTGLSGKRAWGGVGWGW